jgi:hypothetical protein
MKAPAELMKDLEDVREYIWLETQKPADENDFFYLQLLDDYLNLSVTYFQKYLDYLNKED